jgi:hypothetical protein
MFKKINNTTAIGKELKSLDTRTVSWTRLNQWWKKKGLSYSLTLMLLILHECWIFVVC